MATSHRTARAVAFVLIATLILLPTTAAIAGQGATPKPKVALTDDDQKLLDGLIKQGLFDPTGAERVRTKTVVRTVSARSRNTTREAWFQKGAADAPGRVTFLDGATRTVSDRKALEPIDFVAACRSRFEGRRKEPSTPDEIRRERFGSLRKNEVEEIDKSPLAIAAWLHRLGDDDLAARALGEARAADRRNGEKVGDKEMVAEFRLSLAWIAFAEMVHAFMVSEDDEALAAGERLFHLYPEEAKQFDQAQAIVADLQRRKKAGTFGKKQWIERPTGFEQWDVAKQVAHCIEGLDQIAARQFSQPGYVILAEDPRVQALIRIGDPAVPALIDTVEKDERLTRSVHYWRDFSRDRTVLSVREAALDGVMSITGTRFFESRSTSDNFTNSGESAGKRMAGRLRAYWDKYGKLPFDDRMMKILMEPDSGFEAKREAAHNLAHLGVPRLVTTSGTRVSFSRPGGTRKPPSPAVKKFKSPTTAAAILAAMDDDLKHYDAQPRDDLYDYRRREIETAYMQSLVDLGDETIAAELIRRSKSAQTVRERRMLADAARQLGDANAIVEFAKDVEKGALPLPANDRPDANVNDQPGNVALRGIIEDLAKANVPQADRALYAITEPNHPYFEVARARVTQINPGIPGNEVWFNHPYCLKILRRELDNKEPTGGTYHLDEKSLILENKDGSSSQTEIPSLLNDPERRKETVAERHCDRAAAALEELVIGLPEYHPLLKDADERLNEMKRVFDGYRNGFRRVTENEGPFLNIYGDDPAYIPDMPPLNRPATEDDVKAGHAIFHLDGKGKPARLQLPAVAEKKEGEKPTRMRLSRSKLIIVMQAEIDTDGKTFFGVIGDGPPRKANADNFTNIKPMKKKSIFDLFR